MLEVKNICTGYSGIQVLWDVSLEVKNGEMVALVGANGAGKSTLLKTIAGLLRQSSGAIVFENKPIEKLPAHEVVARGLALVPEGRRVFPYMTVRENLEMGAFTVKSQEQVEKSLERVFALFPK